MRARAYPSAVRSGSGQRTPAQKAVAARSAPSETRAGAVGQDRAAPARSESQTVAAAMEPAAPPSELVSAEGRNRKAVLCQRCGSRVLQPGTALFSRRQVGRPGAGLEPPGLGASFSRLQVPGLNSSPGPSPGGRKWRRRGFGKLTAGNCGAHPVSTTCGLVTRTGSPQAPPWWPRALGAGAPRGPEDRDAQDGVGRRCPSRARGVRAASPARPPRAGAPALPQRRVLSRACLRRRIRTLSLGRPWGVRRGRRGGARAAPLGGGAVAEPAGVS